MVNKKINKKVVLILGANGQLGSCLKKISFQYSDLKCFFYSKKQLNINDNLKLEKIVNKLKPKYIINTAAYTNVDGAETNRNECIKVNSKSLIKIAKLCSVKNIILIHFSTDYVYSGRKKSKYKESDYKSPISFYGLSKLRGEKNIIKNMKNFFIIRISGLFSNHKNSFINKIINLSKKNITIKVVNDQITKPIFVDEICIFVFSLISKNLAKKNNFGVYNFPGRGNKTTWYKIAKIIEKKFIAKEIKFSKILPAKSNELSFNAKRPANSSLDNKKIIKNFKIKQKHWKVNVENVLNDILSSQ